MEIGLETKLAPAARSRRRRWPYVLLGLVVLVGAWFLWDLYGPRTAHLREFDPDEIGRLETDMWRAYYDKKEVLLFRQLSQMLRRQFNLPLVRSNAVAYQAARAAFVFKKGKKREDYEQALPYLRAYYGEIRRVSDVPFDVEKVSRLELEWWIIHRERAQHKPEDLPRALAELAGALYGIPPERAAEHARLRAEAMTIRDTKAEQGAVTEADWQRIAELLRASWQSLHQAVKAS